MVINSSKLILRIWYGESPMRYRCDITKNRSEKAKCSIYKIANGQTWFNQELNGEETDLPLMAFEFFWEKLGAQPFSLELK